MKLILLALTAIFLCSGNLFHVFSHLKVLLAWESSMDHNPNHDNLSPSSSKANGSNAQNTYSHAHRFIQFPRKTLIVHFNLIGAIASRISPQ